MLWTIFVVLGILWLLGFSLHVGGGLIHLLLVVALVVLVYNLVSGRRSAVEARCKGRNARRCALRRKSKIALRLGSGRRTRFPASVSTA